MANSLRPFYRRRTFQRVRKSRHRSRIFSAPSAGAEKVKYCRFGADFCFGPFKAGLWAIVRLIFRLPKAMFESGKIVSMPLPKREFTKSKMSMYLRTLCDRELYLSLFSNNP